MPPSSDEATLGLLTVSGQLSCAGWCRPFTCLWWCIHLWRCVCRGGKQASYVTLPARSTLVQQLASCFWLEQDAVWAVLCEAQWSGLGPCWSRIPSVNARPHRLSALALTSCGLGKHALHLLGPPMCGGVPRCDSASGSMGSGTRSTNAVCSWSQEGFSSCCAYMSP